MKLNDRKLKILEAIITDYVATAEPVGSRTIAKKYDFGISPATIRNEMSDLEDMGLIEQPHTSSGRVPSESGYRLYVDSMMQKRGLTEDESEFLKNAISFNVNRIEYLMQQTAKAISALTHYTTVVTEPKKNVAVKIRHMQLVPVDSTTVAAVVVTDTRDVKNHIIRAAYVPDTDVLYSISRKISVVLRNKTLDEVDAKAAQAVLDEFPEYQELIVNAFKAIISTIEHEEDVKLYTSGARNLLGFPEFSDVNKARNVFQALEEKDMLIKLLGGGENAPADKIEIVIGAESNMEELKDCSIVRANYKAGKNSVGRIGIIGPTRMKYSQTVSVLDEIVRKLDSIIDAMLGGGEDG